MTVKELIEELGKMPPDARVFHLWDGEPRTAINVVYETKNGMVMTADYDMDCYSTKARPKDAPSFYEDKNWTTPKNEGDDLDDIIF